MGGGSGAATNVDSVPSPRRAAIDKAQAELRLEVSVKEELKKELDFLEKGGNLLDYRFGEPLLPRFAAEVLSSELDDLSARSPIRSSLENGRYLEQETGICRIGGEVRENGSVRSPGHANDGPVPRSKNPEEIQGIESRKDQTSTKKLKQKEIGNGNAAAPRCVLPESDQSSSMCRIQVPPTCSADVREIGTCVAAGNDGRSKDDSSEIKVADDDPKQKPIEHIEHRSEEIKSISSSDSRQDGRIVESPIETDRNQNVSASVSTEVVPVPKLEPGISDKAQEDMILEAAETIKSARKNMLEFSRQKPGPEPARTKSHWDFVLEEMAWMANDFMQERLWKTAAAAQVCRWTAQQLHKSKVAESDLKKNKKRIAHVLADIVTRYWHSAKNKPDESAPNRNDDSIEAVPMEIDPAPAPALDQAPDPALDQAPDPAPAPAENPQSKVRPIQKYMLRASTDLELPKLSNSISDSLFLMEQFQFPEESLVFIVAEGALENYRISIEKNWDAFVSEKILQDSLNEQRISGICPELDLYGDDTRSFGGRASPKIPEEDYGMHYMPGDLTISKKKRKRIMKAQTSKAYDGISQVPGAAAAYCDGIALPAKKPIGTMANSIGLVPPKRMRSSAVGARQRAAMTMSPGAHRGNGSSASTNSQQEDFVGFPDSRVSESDSGPRKGALGTSSFRSKKKKKKAFNSEFSTDAMSNSHLAKDSESFQLEQDQLKRKGDQYSPMSSEHDTPGTPGSAGMHPMKKLKTSKHSPEFAEVGPSAPQAATNLATSSKILRQNSARDRIRRNKATKGFIQSINPPGVGIPWSATEDQAILALVHDLGPNWELVSDVLSSSSQLKGIFRKPKDCKDRHKALLDRLSNDNGDNHDEPGTSSNLLPKQQSARVFLQRLQGPMEEDTVKVHLERIVNIVQTHRSKQQQSLKDALENQELLPVHASHLSTVSQYSLSGVPLSPLDLCEHPVSNGDIPAHGYSLPQHPLNMPGIMAPNGMRPNSSGLPLLPHLGSIVSPGSAAINAAAARDAQRMAASMRPLSAEEQRLRYTRMVTGRSLQPQSSSPGNMSMASLPNSSDCSMPMLPSGNAAGLMGLNRGLSLPRPSIPGLMSPGPSPGLIPPGGVALPATGSMMAGGIPSPANFMKRAREATQLIRSGRCSEEQKQHFIQELQHHAAQGNPQAVAALNTLSSNMNISNPMASSPTQSFAPQQQHLSPQQQSQQQQQQQQQYLAAVRLVNERQQQQQQQQQQQKRIFPQSNSMLQQHQLGMLPQQLSPNHHQQQHQQQQQQHQQQQQQQQQQSQLGQQKVQVPSTQTKSLTKPPQQQLLQVPQSKVGKSTASNRTMIQQPNPQLSSPPGSGQSQPRSYPLQQATKSGKLAGSGQNQAGQLQASANPQQKNLQKQSPQGASPVPAAPSTPPPQQQPTSAVAPASQQQAASAAAAATTTQAQAQRRQQLQQQQQQQRKSQQKQMNSNNVNTLGKNSTQATMQTLGGSVSTGSSSSGVASPAAAAAAAAAMAPAAAGSWKPGQNYPGMYNLTRSTSGVANATTNGNGQGTAAKIGVVPAVNGRTLAQQQQQQGGGSGGGGGQRPAVQQQQPQQQQSLPPVPVPVPTNTMNSTRAARPSSSSSSMAVPSSPAYQGASLNQSIVYGVQPRQVHSGGGAAAGAAAARPATNGSNPSVTTAPPSVVTSSSSPR